MILSCLLCWASACLSWSSVVEVLCLSSRWPHSFQQRCGFRKATRKPESKKVEEEWGSPHAESSEAAVPRRTSTPHWDQQAPPSRDFSRLFRPLVFTVGVGAVYLCMLGVTWSVMSWIGVNSMSVYRLLFWLSGHLAVRVPQVSSPELLWWDQSWLAGEGATSETRRHPQRGEVTLSLSLNEEKKKCCRLCHHHHHHHHYHCPLSQTDSVGAAALSLWNTHTRVWAAAVQQGAVTHWQKTVCVCVCVCVWPWTGIVWVILNLCVHDLTIRMTFEPDQSINHNFIYIALFVQKNAKRFTEVKNNNNIEMNKKNPLLPPSLSI